MQVTPSPYHHPDILPDIIIPLSTVDPFSNPKLNTPPSPFRVNIQTSSGTTTPALTRPSSQLTNNDDNSNSSSKSTYLPPPGLTPPPSFISQLFHETVRNAHAPVSCLTGTTKVEDSGDAPEDTSDHHDLTSMSPSRGCPSRAHTEQSDTTPVGPLPRRHSVSAPRHSLSRHSFSQPSFYATRSEQSTSPSAYPSPPPAGFVGQYMSSQPPHSMPTLFSSPFAHPGIHAHDPSAMGLHFHLPPPMGRSFSYAAPAQTAEVEHDPRSLQGYIPNSPPPFALSTSASQAPSSSTQQTSPHHNFVPSVMHFSPPPPGPHYAYPSHSYAQPSPGLFAYPAGPYPFYAQPAPTPTEDVNNGGTWWYVPPAGGAPQYDPPYPGLYPVQGYQTSMRMRPEFDRSYHAPSSAGPSGQQHVLQRQPTFPPPSPVFPSPFQSSGPSPAVSTPPNYQGSSSHSAHSSIQAKRRGMADNASVSVSSPPRRAYHPNPPHNRSEWVMWVGNVPADATHDALYRFFNQVEPQHPAPPGTSAILSSRLVQPPSSPVPNERWGGVSSVFLISRSNCAFINFTSEEHLTSAVAHFNDKPLRPKDPRCPRLVCRVRRKDDDLRAGVGGQRGMGLHGRWVEEQKAREKEKREDDKHKGKGTERGRRGEEDRDVDGPSTSPSTYLAPSSSSDPSPPIPAISPVDNEPHCVPISSGSSPEDADKKPRHGSSGDRSFASTTSSMFAQYFPQRYFILKSLTQYDLNLSVERQVWATQAHNEGILDQAYRTSKDVYLIFGANKSGEFFGYARMAGSIFHNERVEQAPWASRSSRRESSPIVEEEEQESRSTFLTPGSERPLIESPAAITPDREMQGLRINTSMAKESLVTKVRRAANTAPAETRPHEQLEGVTLPVGAETYHEIHEKQPGHAKGLKQDGRFALKYPGLRPSAQPVHTTSEVIPRLATLSQHPRSDNDGGGIAQKTDHEDGDSLQQHGESDQDKPNERPDGWGREFKVQWLCTERLPFHRTRHLRNPWNQDREVKVSRDGTELEPSVGQRLFEEWNKPEPIPAATASAGSSTSPLKPSRSRPAGRAGASSSTAQTMPSFASQMTRPGTGGFSGRGRGAHT